MKKQRLSFVITVLIAIAAGACKPNTETSANVQPLTGVISDTTARRLVRNFTGRAHMFKNSQDKTKGYIYPDTRSVWFSIGQLKALIDSIAAEKGDGVRFYLAAYDSLKKPDSKVSDKYLNYTTLVMVSTRPDSAKRYHIDYYTSRKDKSGKKGAIIMALPENQGELCPPPANCNAYGATLLP